MVSRTTEATVTFAHPFTLASLDEPQPAGRYRLVIDEEEIVGLSFLAFRRTATVLELPALAKGQCARQHVPVSEADLEAALTKDRQKPA